MDIFALKVHESSDDQCAILARWLSTTEWVALFLGRGGSETAD